MKCLQCDMAGTVCLSWIPLPKVYRKGEEGARDVVEDVEEADDKYVQGGFFFHIDASSSDTIRFVNKK